ncbi:MAG: hypothetical protein OFPII_17040 [Osedax symbiont Rs1]|nr:MAG: hypothetical protein OFPII_17040 [Osedax symbiont Rs1]
MSEFIAIVDNMEGSVSAINDLGIKRDLVVGDALYLDEVVRTASNGSVDLQVSGGAVIKLESLQSIKLTADTSPEQMLDQSDAVLNSDLPLDLVEKLFSVYPLGVSSILAEIEPVYDIERIKLTEHRAEGITLVLSEVLLNTTSSESLDQYIRFDQDSHQTVIYISNSGDFVGDATTEQNVDKVLTINSVGYNSSAELISFLIDNYLIIDQA